MRFAALLRAVNVGGRSLPMAQLRQFCERLGFTDVRTLLQSGNAIFGSALRSSGTVEKALEAEAEAELGLAVDFVVRSAAEWAALVAANPFTAEAKSDPARLVAVVLKAAPPPAAVSALRAVIVGRERAQTNGKAAYVVYPDGQGQSKLTLSVIERKLATTGTARNWNTVLKIDAALHKV